MKKKVNQQGDWVEYQVDGNPLHNVYENVKTGEKSYKDHQERKITNFEECPEHYFEVASRNGDIECARCGYPRKIVWGIHIVKDGKLIKL
jgi:hypothetical protein